MMIEKIILDYLSENLDVPVYMEVPEDMPETFITIEKTGSGEENHIFTAMIAIQSYGPSMLAAAELNDRVKIVMSDIIELAAIGACDLNSDYNYTNTVTKQYRYQAVFDIVHY